MYFTYTRRAQPFKFASYPRYICVSVETRTFSSSNSHVSHLQSLSRLEQSFPSACRISNPNVPGNETSRDSRWFGPCRIRRSRETNGLISRVHCFLFTIPTKRSQTRRIAKKTRWNKHIPYLQSILDIFKTILLTSQRWIFPKCWKTLKKTTSKVFVHRGLSPVKQTNA